MENKIISNIEEKEYVNELNLIKSKIKETYKRVNYLANTSLNVLYYEIGEKN